MWGSIFLTVALLGSVFSLIMYFLTIKGYENTLKPARLGFYFSAVFVFLAASVLMNAIITHQYQYRYVFNYSSDGLPFGLLLSTFYAGQEGSFMIWLLFTVVIGFVLIRYTARREDLEPRVMFVFTLAVFFLLVMVSPLLKNPFLYIWASPTFVEIDKINPAYLSNGLLQNFIFQSSSNNQTFIKITPELYGALKGAGISINDLILHGRGLNPLLQNFWMQIHPPLLFVGFALSTVPFAFALASLIKNDYKKWVTHAFPWTLAAMMVLGLAIMLGGYWSYGVLGWGGYWGWDPVENSSLIPWIVGVALVHTMVVQRQTQKDGSLGRFAKTNLVLAILTFILVLYSTFLTRSGILGDSSVHSFVAPGMIVYFFLIVFIVTFLILGFGALVWRWKDIESAPMDDEALFSRELALFTGAVVLLASALIIFVGTSAPIFGVSVETRFYDQMNLPIAIIMGLLNGLSVLIRWRYNKGREVLKSLSPSLIISFLITVLLIVAGITDLMFILLTFSSVFTIISNLEVILKIRRKNITRWGAYLSHIGVGLFFLGVITTGGYSVQKDVDLIKNRPASVLGYDLTFLGNRTIDNGKKYAFDVLVKDGKDSLLLSPVMYFSQLDGSLMREPDIKNRITRDIYLSPLSYSSDNSPNGADELGISKGETKRIGDYEISFLGFVRDENQMKLMMAGKPFEVGAELNVVYNGKTYRAVPKYISGGEHDEYLDAEIPELNLRIEMTKLDAAGHIHLLLSKLDEKPARTNSQEIFSAEVSVKPFVNLLWLGVIVITLGFLFAMLMRLKETRISVQ